MDGKFMLEDILDVKPMKFRVNVYCLTLASHVLAETRPCTNEKFPLGQVQENKAVLGLGTHVYKPLAVCTKVSYSRSSSWVFTAHLPTDTSCGGELTPPTCPMHKSKLRFQVVVWRRVPLHPRTHRFNDPSHSFCNCVCPCCIPLMPLVRFQRPSGAGCAPGNLFCLLPIMNRRF